MNYHNSNALLSDACQINYLVKYLRMTKSLHKKHLFLKVLEVLYSPLVDLFYHFLHMQPYINI